jgi:hypothetical protein
MWSCCKEDQVPDEHIMMKSAIRQECLVQNPQNGLIPHYLVSWYLMVPTSDKVLNPWHFKRLSTVTPRKVTSSQQVSIIIVVRRSQTWRPHQQVAGRCSLQAIVFNPCTMSIFFWRIGEIWMWFLNPSNFLCFFWKNYAIFDKIEEIIFQKIKICKFRKIIVGSWSYLLEHEPEKVIGPSSIGSMEL